MFSGGIDKQHRAVMGEFPNSDLIESTENCLKIVIRGSYK